jgi:hypothetical protein
VEIDQLEMLATGHKPRFLVTAVPYWAPAMKRAGGTERLLQQVSDVVAEQARQPRLTGDIYSEPGGPTIIRPGSVTSEQLAGCITTDRWQPGPVKDPVAAATNAGITRSGLQTISGVALQEGDRVLVKDQADASENGIYIASAASGLWERAPDADSSAKLVPGVIVIDSATGTAYYLDAIAPVTLGTSDLNWRSLTGASSSQHDLFDVLAAEAPDGSRVNFTLVGVTNFIPMTLRVYLNGLRQLNYYDFAESYDGSGFSMSVPPLAGDILWADCSVLNE